MDFHIKSGDTTPVITATLTDSAGAAVNLTGATVRFIMRKGGTSSAKVTGEADIGSPASGGEVSYTWEATDTDTPGIYSACWEVTFSGGAIQTFPNAGYTSVAILPQLDDPVVVP